jgi:hypothetical protein
MLRLLGAPALALTMMTAGPNAAHAAHRHHHGVQGHGIHGHGIHAGHRHHAAHFGFRDRSFMDGVPDRYLPGEARERYVADEPRERYAGGAARAAFGGTPRGGRPRAWCGWYARSLVGHDPGAGFNLARNWTHWGRPASPGVGVMVVWSHHVGMITGRTPDGQWIIKSGNDGHGVRERPRSITRAIAFRAS